MRSKPGDFAIAYPTGSPLIRPSASARKQCETRRCETRASVVRGDGFLLALVVLLDELLVDAVEFLDGQVAQEVPAGVERLLGEGFVNEFERLNGPSISLISQGSSICNRRGPSERRHERISRQVHPVR
jgi:hypothetical protein